MRRNELGFLRGTSPVTQKMWRFLNEHFGDPQLACVVPDEWMQEPPPNWQKNIFAPNGAIRSDMYPKILFGKVTRNCNVLLY